MVGAGDGSVVKSTYDFQRTKVYPVPTLDGL